MEKGSFQKSPFLEILREILDLENPQTVDNKGESDHFLKILEILEILEIRPVKDPFRNDPLCQPRFIVFVPAPTSGKIED